MFTTLRPRLVPNCTAPAASANSVSSPPRPTPVPGWKCVPRWRTRISPAFTTWPPNRLTPSRWALESRPFRLDDAPFLCAMCRPLLSDTGDLDLGVRLAVAHAPLVPGLAPVVHDVDLRALDGAEDLGRDLVLGHLAGFADDALAVDDEHGRQRDRRADLTGHLVDGENVVDGH